MEALDIVLRVAGFVATLSAGSLAFIYQRRLTSEASAAKLATLQSDTIHALEVQMRLLKETVDSGELSLKQCERQRDAAHQALEAWDRLVGNIWINHAKTQADDGD